MKGLARLRYILEWCDGVWYQAGGVHTSYWSAVRCAKKLCVMHGHRYGRDVHVTKLTVLR